MVSARLHGGTVAVQDSITNDEAQREDRSNVKAVHEPLECLRRAPLHVEWKSQRLTTTQTLRFRREEKEKVTYRNKGGSIQQPSTSTKTAK